MAEEAQCGVMLWDGKSKGTLQNMLNLIAAGKRTLVYFAPTQSFYVVANRDELPFWLDVRSGIATAPSGHGG